MSPISSVNLPISNAAEASVILTKAEAKVRLTVEDNGRGFDVTRVGKFRDGSEGMGLRGIAERVRLMGGTLEIQSRPTEGTRLLITVPCKKP